MRRLTGSAALVSATWLAMAVVVPTAVSSAAENSATASIPIDPVTTLEIHTNANCVKADNQCYFTSSANLLTPDGPTGFPPQFYARQNTTLRSIGPQRLPGLGLRCAEHPHVQIHWAD